MLSLKFKSFGIVSLGLAIILSQNTNAGDKEILAQIAEGYEFSEQLVHGSQVAVLESKAYTQAYHQSLRIAVKSRILEEVSPYFERRNQLMKNGVVPNVPKMKKEILEINKKIEEFRDKEYITKLYIEEQEKYAKDESNYCHDLKQVTLRAIEDGKTITRCITAIDAKKIIEAVNEDPSTVASLGVKFTPSQKPQEVVRKLYYCYKREVSILGKSKSCSLRQFDLSDKELEEVGKENCYPVDNRYKKVEGDGYSTMSALRSKCVDEICTNPSEQINYENFKLISFIDLDPKSCVADNSNSRVCAQTYTCQNKTYQVTCEFDKEEYNGNNKCNVIDINKSTMINKCRIVELGTEV